MFIGRKRIKQIAVFSRAVVLVYFKQLKMVICADYFSHYTIIAPFFLIVHRKLKYRCQVLCEQ